MKIALCLSGQPRTYKKCFKSIKKHLIDQWKIEDVFIHFWWDEKTNNQGNLASWTYTSYVGDDEKKNYTPSKKKEPDLYSDLKKLYNPKLIRYDKPISNKLSKTPIPKFPNVEKLDYYNRKFLENKNMCFLEYPEEYQKFLHKHNKNMFKSQYLCSKLKREHEKIIGQKYDIVIRTRFDVVFNDMVSFGCGGKLPPDLWEQSANRGIGRFLPSLFQLKKDRWGYLSKKEKGIYMCVWDNFWIYTSEVHDLMMEELYINFEKNFWDEKKIKQKSRNIGGGPWGTPETLQQFVMKKHQLKTVVPLAGEALSILR